MTLRAIADAVLAALLAPPCAACGGLLERPLDGAICARCWLGIERLTPPLCDACGEPLADWRSPSAHGLCPRCRRIHSAVDRARAIGPYRGSLRSIVHALKYDRRVSAARGLAALMRQAGADVLAGADAVVPVPLHARRRRRRGFNQAALIAAHLGLPVRRLLRRLRHTRPQVELPAARRHRNVRGAFAIRRERQPLARCAAILRRLDGKGPTDLSAGAHRAKVEAGPHDVTEDRLPTPGMWGQPSAHQAWGPASTRQAWGPASAGQAWGPASAGPSAGIHGSILVLIDDVATTGATLHACALALKAAGAREVRALTAARAVSERRPAPDR